MCLWYDIWYKKHFQIGYISNFTLLLFLNTNFYNQTIPSNVDCDFAIAKGAAILDAIDRGILKIGKSKKAYIKNQLVTNVIFIFII